MAREGPRVILLRTEPVEFDRSSLVEGSAMIRLYSGGGSGEVILDDPIANGPWQQLKVSTIRLLTQLGHREAARLLSEIPFALYEGHNGFGDEFKVLVWTAPIDRYAEASEWPSDPQRSSAFRQIASAVGEIVGYVRFIVVEPDLEEGAPAVVAPRLQTTSEFVERALADAEMLIARGGAASGTDRVHAALHGFLEAVCDTAGIAHPADSSITDLLSRIKREHPVLANAPDGDKVLKILRGFGGIVDTLNPVRNNQSMAHPTNDLLGEAEAMLVINAIRTLMHYLDAKLR